MSQLSANVLHRAAATGRHLFDDFDFFLQSFPALCLRLLSPSAPLDSTLCINPSDSWSTSTPWEQQREALSRAVEERAQLLRRKDSVLSPTYEDASTADLNVDKFHQHISHVFSLWSKLSESNRQDAWQREIVRSYARMEKALKEAQATICALRRNAEMLTKRLDRSGSIISPYQQSFADRLPPISVPPSPLDISNDLLRDLSRHGINSSDWDYQKLLDRWKGVARDERRASTGLQAQRPLANKSPRMMNNTNSLSVAGAPASTVSRSVSIASAMSATAPSRTSSMDSPLDADAEGEEEDMEADNVAPDAHSYARKPQDQQFTQGRILQPGPQNVPTDPRITTAYPAPQVQLDQNYKWPQQIAVAHQQMSDHGTVKRLPPGPDSWHAEFHHATTHSMEGIEGPATTAAASMMTRPAAS